MIEANRIYKNKFGDLLVVFYKNSANIFVEFVDTKSRTWTNSAQINRGAVRDRAIPSVVGVGYIGFGKHKAGDGKGGTNKTYQTWKDMIKRCYCPKRQKASPTYKGCTVCKEWHNFQNFAKWYDENYPDDGGDYFLDKDISCHERRGKLYSPKTCSMVTRQENAQKAFAKLYLFTSPSGDVERIYNLHQFCMENGLNPSSMYCVTTGKRKSHKGWRKTT